MIARLTIASCVLALAQALSVMPAAAATAATAEPSRTEPAAVAPLEPCPPGVQDARLAQVASTDCCKDQKGICGCRAGKIVCCDSKPSTHPGCTCRGDDGFLE